MTKLNRSEKRYLIITLVALLVLWILGPYFSFANVAIFSSWMTRLILTVLAGSLWGGYFFWCYKFKAVTTHKSLTQTPLPENNIKSELRLTLAKIAKGESTSFKHFLNMKRKKSTPWILLLGPQGCGKTTLLAKSNIAMISPLQKTLNKVNATQSIDWWVSDDAVFIDPAGKYALPLDNPAAQSYWDQFLTEVTKEHSQPFASVCLVIDLPSLLYPEEASYQKLLNDIQQQVHALTKVCQPLCFNIVISQADHITGFAEFFKDLNPEEQQQAFGFSLNDPNITSHLSERFENLFAQFVRSIHTRLLKRLHHEPNLNRRLRIQSLTPQLERLTKPLLLLLEKLPAHQNIVVNNVFFCSAKQATETVNMLAEPLKNTFQLQAASTKPLISKQQSLFITGMLKKLSRPLAPKHALSEKLFPEGKNWWHILSYPIALAIVLITTGAYHYSYQQNVTAIQAITQDLTKPTNNKNWLSELNRLETVRKELVNNALLNNGLLSFGQASKLKTEINARYQNYLKYPFTQHLNQTLKISIERQSNDNSPRLYNSLQVYLMLAQKSHDNPAFVKNWFDRYWQKTLPEDSETRHQLAEYLNDTLALKNLPWAQDAALIHQAQTTLQKQPLSEIAFKMLRNSGDPSTASIDPSESVKGVDLNQSKIPVFYSPKNFSVVYKQKIPALAKRFYKGNWVVGNTDDKNVNQAQLTQELQQRYLQQYLQTWQNSLNQIHFTTPKDYDAAMTQINLLTNPQSPIWQLYQNVIMTVKNAGVKLDATTLNAFMPSQQDQQTMVKSLQALQTYLQSINKSPSSIKTSYDQAKIRFQNNGTNDAITQVFQDTQQMPAPLRQWMNAIARNSWTLMLTDAKAYLNTLWQTNIVPAYNNTIKQRFPVFQNATNDIGLNDFNHFFAPGGAIQQYFSDNMTPFIDMSKSYWTWKKLDDQQLDIPQNVLDMFIRASMIQKMFYTNNQKTPTIRFKLTPMDMSIDTSQFILNVGGQMVRYMPGIKRTSVLSWPGKDGNFVTMRFNNLNQTNPTVTTMGNWAWLRMLQHATIKPSNNPSSYDVTFKMNNNEAEYQLQADNSVNPYLPGILNGFRLPSVL